MSALSKSSCCTFVVGVGSLRKGRSALPTARSGAVSRILLMSWLHVLCRRSSQLKIPRSVSFFSKVQLLDCQSMYTRAGLRSRPEYITTAFEKGITLYTAGTPNGWKANMIVEELKVPYKLHAISLSDNEQKQEWFEKINPNGRIPAIGKSLQAHDSNCRRMFEHSPQVLVSVHAVDHDEGDLPVFESGAIMIHLAEKDPQGTFLPKDIRKKAEVISWLMFQMVKTIISCLTPLLT